jgi:hypothetical protein
MGFQVPTFQGFLWFFFSFFRFPRLRNLWKLNCLFTDARDLIKSYSARSKQSTFNLAHFLGSFGAYTYVEGTKKKNTGYLLEA